MWVMYYGKWFKLIHGPWVTFKATRMEKCRDKKKIEGGNFLEQKISLGGLLTQRIDHEVDRQYGKRDHPLIPVTQ